MIIRLAMTLCLLAGACKGEDSAEQVDAQPAMLSASDYCESISGFFCDFYLRCGRMHAADKAECLLNFDESCNSKFEAAYVDLEETGLLRLDPAGLSACESHLEDVVCEQQVFELSGPCQSIWEGLVPTGGSCGLDVEYFVCDRQSDCVLGLDFCGTCRELVAIGATCVPGETSCGAAGFCEDDVCKARKQNGEACGQEDRCFAGSSCDAGLCTGPNFVVLGAACDRDNRCPYMTECIAGTCEAAVLQSESCSATSPCGTGYCAESICRRPQADGASCTSAGQCASGLCRDDLCAGRPSACLN